MPSSITDIEILQAALVGLQHQASEIDMKMAELRARVGGGPPATAPGRTQAKKRVLSPAARRRIAAAQRNRWAAYRREEEASVPVKKVAPAKPAAKKRKLSPAAKKRIGDATKKRWAAFRAAKAAAAMKKTVQPKKSIPANKRQVASKARKRGRKKSVASPAAPAEVSGAPETTTA
jgi:hypothetical protein